MVAANGWHWACCCKEDLTGVPVNTQGAYCSKFVLSGSYYYVDKAWQIINMGNRIDTWPPSPSDYDDLNIRQNTSQAASGTIYTLDGGWGSEDNRVHMRHIRLRRNELSHGHWCFYYAEEEKYSGRLWHSVKHHRPADITPNQYLFMARPASFTDDFPQLTAAPSSTLYGENMDARNLHLFLVNVSSYLTDRPPAEWDYTLTITLPKAKNSTSLTSLNTALQPHAYYWQDRLLYKEHDSLGTYHVYVLPSQTIQSTQTYNWVVSSGTEISLDVETDTGGTVEIHLNDYPVFENGLFPLAIGMELSSPVDWSTYAPAKDPAGSWMSTAVPLAELPYGTPGATDYYQYEEDEKPGYRLWERVSYYTQRTPGEADEPASSHWSAGTHTFSLDVTRK